MWNSLANALESLELLSVYLYLTNLDIEFAQVGYLRISGNSILLELIDNQKWMTMGNATV